MAHNLKFSPLWIGTLLLLGLLVYINWPQTNKHQTANSVLPPVVTQTIDFQPLAIVIEALGTAEANESVTLTAQQAAVVTNIEFDDGDQVQQSEVLLELDNRAEKARVNELEINLAEARRQLARIDDLAKEKVASQQLLDEQKARVDALNAQLEVANADLSKRRITAPFTGKLGIRQVSRGSLVRPGDVITTLDDISRVKVDFNVSENHLASLTEGQDVSATSVAYPGEAFIGKITSIDTRLDPITRSIRVRAIIDNTAYRLRPGMLLQIIVQKQVIDTLMIAEKALIPIQDQQFVFVVEDNKAIQTEVIVGERRPGKVQILSGLEAGQQVVTQGAIRLKDGSSVQVLTSN